MTENVVRAAVLGHPVMHTKSPIIHNYWVQKYNLEGKYEAIDVKPSNFESKVKHLFDEGYIGFNVTVPHKEAALEICDEVDDVARMVGAVNTIYKKLGKIHGTNTDVFGFVQNIRQQCSSFDFTSGAAVVLGAGGAGHAVVHGLLEEGVHEIRVFNRNRDRAEVLAEKSKNPSRVKVFDWQERSQYFKDVILLVNTTVLGMQAQPALDIDLTDLPQDALVNDIVYAPLYTALLKSAKERGNPVVTGIGMLLHQARPSFNKWFGVMPEVDEDLMSLVTT